MNFNSNLFVVKSHILATISAVSKGRNGEWSMEVGTVRGPPILQGALKLCSKTRCLESCSPLATVFFVDDLLHKNQQLNMQVTCLNQELAQLKKLEETVALLHESQR